MAENRQYVRMSTVFPVEIEVYQDDETPGSQKLLQAFTRDVSAGGMCLELKSFGKEEEELLLKPEARLFLSINPPFSHHPIKAVSKIVWIRKDISLLPIRYLIGVSYTTIDGQSRKRLIDYANRLRWVPRLASLVFLAVVLAVLILYTQGQTLILENKKLVKDVILSADAKSEISSNLSQLQKKRKVLEAELIKAHEKILSLELASSQLQKDNTTQKNVYQSEIRRILEDQRNIEEALVNVDAGKEKLEVSYAALDVKEKTAGSSVLHQMGDWIQSHQNLKTGLVASFEGDVKLEDWAFTYDQALACQVFLLFGENERAARTLSFFESKAEASEGVYFNVYDAADGRPIERQIIVGPNLWIGIAVLQYTKQTQDNRYLPMAEQIADWMIRQQDHEGGIKGGPEFSWYSTEHHLDAYAFFSMLHRVTGENRYVLARNKTLSWIKKYAYSVKEKRMNRGKGDATIATDTFSWAVAALGPATLKEMLFDPEEIIRFAEDHCAVSVTLKKAGQKTVKVDGFDFSKAGHIGRSGVISTEWTAQMIVAYKILADYFKAIDDKDKSSVYQEKAKKYLNELQKLIITSPSRTGQGRGCLPYATADNVDTGHGWRTPGGSKTGSVAGTAYGIFAWFGYNPFYLDNESLKHP